MNRPCTLVASVSALALMLSGAHAQDGMPMMPLAHATAKVEGLAAPNALAPQLDEVIAAFGTMPLENPSATFSHYGFAADGPMLPAPAAVQAKGRNVEATKTEPDKNTYLVLAGQAGADAGYDYGSHFLFQGHEVGPQDAKGNSLGLLTR